MELRPIAWRPLLLVGAGELALLVATAGRYGFHRDELYFRVAGRHLAWGYPDQPPLTPLLGRVSIALFGDTPRGMRVAAALASTLCVVLTGMIARELGGGAAAQTIAALSIAVSGFLLAGHLLVTATPDIAIWTILGFLLVRLLRTGDRRLRLALGLVTGIGLLNKHLVLLFWSGALVGLAATRQLGLLRSRWVAAGALVAGALWAPNLLWQAQHGWPQIEPVRQISREDPNGVRTGFLPLQLAIVGPLVSVVWIAGLVRPLARARPEPRLAPRRRRRPLARSPSRP